MLGQAERGLATLRKMLFGKCGNTRLFHNMLDWMGKPAFPLVKEYMTGGGSRKGKYGRSILARIVEVNKL